MHGPQPPCPVHQPPPYLPSPYPYNDFSPGLDLIDGQKKMILALISQLMRRCVCHCPPPYKSLFDPNPPHTVVPVRNTSSSQARDERGGGRGRPRWAGQTDGRGFPQVGQRLCERRPGGACQRHAVAVNRGGSSDAPRCPVVTAGQCFVAPRLLFFVTYFQDRFSCHILRSTSTHHNNFTYACTRLQTTPHLLAL
jgi:hypothetical protein